MPIHPSAIVEDGAALGNGVEVGPFCIISRHAKLAEGVRLISHVVISGHTEIGPRTVVHSQAVLGGEGQIRNTTAPDARLIIGADNIIRESVSISAGSQKGGGVTTIGDRCYFMAYSHAGHDCHVGNDVTLANGVQLAGHVEIGDGVIFGGLAATQQHARVGRNAFISGLSGVSTDVIPYGMAIGLHVRLGGLNLVGLRRRGIPRERIHALRAAYRLIFLQGGRIPENAQRAKEQWRDIPEVQEVANFILAKPNRPICPARTRSVEPDED
ncbi:MAG TPA: acyl-ACP--UDP-N-acetylglucosamine O-acyltransferase [Rhizomicrobium sp.]|jgi:UDP-N-acetylglucosamine acyltransferase|nr:acyl-ACP--UDP-N-acetylglucosamine O-acyltransferase [Rhizomicrobium sp.]